MSLLILSFNHVLPTKTAILKENILNYLARTDMNLNQTHKNLMFEHFKPSHNKFLDYLREKKTLKSIYIQEPETEFFFPKHLQQNNFSTTSLTAAVTWPNKNNKV